MTTQRPQPATATATLVWVTIGGLIVFGFATRLAYGFEWDELQLLHGAWRIARGDIPYRDFFEHHPPLLHLLVAPFLGDAATISWRLLVVMRVVGAVVLGGVLIAFARLLRRTAGADAAVAGVAMLVLCPISGKLFELRADWLALLALLVGMSLLLAGWDAEGRRPRCVLFAGMLAGFAMCLTQKAIPLWLGMLTWTALSPRNRSGGTAVGVLRFVGGSCVVPCVMLAWFWRQGAMPSLIQSTVSVNLTWPREAGWEVSWHPSAVAALGSVALALQSIATVAWRFARGAAVGPEATLLALVASCGMVAYVVTPVPWEQSFLMLVVPWVAWLAVDRVADYVRSARRRDVLLTVATALVAATTLPPALAGRALVVAAIVGAMIALASRAPNPAHRLRGAIVALLLPGTVLFLADRARDVAEGRGRAQMRFAHTVTRFAPQGTPVLTLWDHVVPFRPTPVFHWFAHEGVLRRFADRQGATSLDDEYANAVDQGEAAVVIADVEALDGNLPALAGALRRHCRPLADGYAGSDAYACETRTAPALVQETPPEAPNIVLVVIDTLRADHVSCYGYRRPTTPALDVLASQGVLFEQAISQAPWTAASVGSLLTGLYPSVHGIDGGVEWTGSGTLRQLPFVTQRVLRGSVVTLAETLRAHGYRTAGFVSNVYLNGVFGFARGFDTYADDHVDYSGDVMTRKRRGDATNRRVMQWLDAQLAEPFFLFVHYNDPHWPYDPPPPFGTDWMPTYHGVLNPGNTALVVESEGRPVHGLGPKDVAYLEALYDGEIRYADANLGTLIDRLHSTPLTHPVLTVVTADHGEEFLDHGSTSHGYTLYDEQIRVPLVVHLPGRLQSARIPAQVRLIDVMPTIVALAGLPRQRASQGRSLVNLMRGDERRYARDAFSEAPLRGVMRSLRTATGRKLIADVSGDRSQLLDLRHDPRERDDRSGHHEHVAQALHRRLARRVAANARRAARLPGEEATNDLVVDEELRRRLEALGYVPTPEH